jgi:hypothetical protein
MMRFLAVGVASFAMMAGVSVYAQSVYSESTTKSVTAPGYSESTTKSLTNPAQTDGDFHATTTQKRTSADGMTCSP